MTNKQTQAMQTLTSRATVEYFTPRLYVSTARQVMGGIDLDPASHAIPQTWIKAAKCYALPEDGLAHEWEGRIWLNPPYDRTSLWCDKLEYEFHMGRVTQAVLLVNCNMGYRWFDRLWLKFPVCHLRQRVSFIRLNGDSKGEAKRAQCLFYFGRQVAGLADFSQYFGKYGRVLYPQD